MRHRGLLTIVFLVLPCCAGGETAYLIDGGGNASGGSTSAGTTGAGMSAGTNTGTATAGGTSSSAGGTQGTTSAGATGSSGVSTAGSYPPPCVWVNDICALGSCTNAPIGEACARADGGLGSCHDGQCVDVASDPDNCGWPGERCADGVACINRRCALDCASGDGCPNGFVCPYSYGICIALDCSVASDDDACTNQGDAGPYLGLDFCCSGECVQTSAANCGGCGVTCPPTTACFYETCVPVEPCSIANYSFCVLPSGAAGECCAGQCVDILTDPAHCGGCTFACPTGVSCLTSGLTTECAGGCTLDLDCPQGFKCFNGACNLADCTSATEGAECASPLVGYGICCSGACVDPSHTDNCDGCGISCSVGQGCYRGSCVELAQPSTQTNGDLCRLDDAGIGLVCSGTCTDTDYCSVSTCGPGNQPCLGDGGGEWSCCGTACVDILTDPANCGGCGFICPVSLEATCINGGCQCSGGEIDCLADAGCPSGLVLFGSSCLSPACEIGQRICSLGSGHLGTCCADDCVDTSTDPLNCNFCDRACASGLCGGNTWLGCLPSTVSQGCVQSCEPGTICAEGSCVDSRCDSAPYCLAEDGAVGVCCWSQDIAATTFACADLSSDPLNCGTCGVACAGGTACVNGLCNGLAACGPGHAGSYCNLDAGLSFLCCPGLGCIDTSNDPQNCGACNASCGTGQICAAGLCSAH